MIPKSLPGESCIIHILKKIQITNITIKEINMNKFKYDYKGFARELLAEIAKNIKDYFVERKIFPNPKKT